MRSGYCEGIEQIDQIVIESFAEDKTSATLKKSV